MVPERKWTRFERLVYYVVAGAMAPRSTAVLPRIGLLVPVHKSILRLRATRSRPGRRYQLPWLVLVSERTLLALFLFESSKLSRLGDVFFRILCTVWSQMNTG